MSSPSDVPSESLDAAEVKITELTERAIRAEQGLAGCRDANEVLIRQGHKIREQLMSEVAALQQKVERLEGALEHIASDDNSDRCDWIARAALSHSEDTDV